MIQGFNHITLSVKDLEQAFQFYKETLGFKALAKRKKKSAYFLAGHHWFVLVEQDKISSESYFHVAFSVNQDAFAQTAERIKKSGAVVWQPNTSPGDSLYFLDPSGNKLEIHAGDWRSRMEWLRKNPDPEVEIFD